MKTVNVKLGPSIDEGTIEEKNNGKISPKAEKLGSKTAKFPREKESPTAVDWAKDKNGRVMVVALSRYCLGACPYCTH